MYSVGHVGGTAVALCVNIPADLHRGLRRALADLEFDHGFKTSLTEVVTAAIAATCTSAADVQQLVQEHRDGTTGTRAETSADPVRHQG